MIAEQAGEEADADLYEVLREYDKLDPEKKKRLLRLIEAGKEETEEEAAEDGKGD